MKIKSKQSKIHKEMVEIKMQTLEGTCLLTLLNFLKNFKKKKRKRKKSNQKRSQNVKK